MGRKFDLLKRLGFAAALFTMALVPPAALGQEQAADDAAGRERLAEMRQRLEGVSARLADEKGNTIELAARATPLIRFNDPARAFHDGAVWAWESEGRPLMLIALEHYETGWTWEVISLAEGKLSASVNDWQWTPEQPGVLRRPIPDAPPPAASERLRLLQMKQLARQFAAFESGGGQQYALRLLPQPLARYADPSRGVSDGALFVLAYGTNPEIVVLIEHRSSEAGAPAWHCAFAPLTTAAAAVHVGDTKLWSKELTQLPKTQQAYTYFSESD